MRQTRAGAHLLAFDSGIGGYGIVAALRARMPAARITMLADNAFYPYGERPDAALIARIEDVIGRAIRRFAPDAVVIACNTASTLVLPHLRERFSVPFIGTVPAIKPAARATRTGYVTVLATPATVARDYTRDLVDTYAGGCKVNLVGSRRFAGFAEAELAGAPVSDEELLAEL